MDATLGLPILIGLIAIALLFDFLNGLHDAANSIATIVSTRVLRPQYAVFWAAFFNFVAFLVFGLHVAGTIGRGIIAVGAISDQVVFGDAGYASDEYKRGARALGMVWRVQDKAKRKGSLGAALSGSQKKRNRRNSGIRARVEHLSTAHCRSISQTSDHSLHLRTAVLLRLA